MASLLSTLKTSSTVKLVTILFITLTMLIPVSMVEDTIYERSSLKRKAEHDIRSRWGGKQNISAPVLAIPYKQKHIEKINHMDGWRLSEKGPIQPVEKEKITYTDHIIYLLADQANIMTELTTETRYLGIYDMPVYISKSDIKGRFTRQDLNQIKDKFSRIDWSNVKLILPIEDVRGIRSISRFTLGKKLINFIPSNEQTLVFNGIQADVDLTRSLDSDLNFAFDISLSGSQQLNYLPLARHNNISLKSDWNSPGFSGSYLPLNREISESGFTANWEILGLNRNFGQMWIDQTVNTNDIIKSEFGFTLYQPADIYQQNTRSAKYAVLFIALTFMAFFLFEIFFKLNIHPLQYFFNGGALSTFYLLLLALSEHLHFSIAYLIASTSTIALITGYSMTILKQTSRGLLMGLLTTLIYSFLYFLVQSEQNSLLFGALGFFIALTTIMYLTRNINWYNIKASETNV